MKKISFLTGLWALTLGLLAPLTSYATCPDQDKTGWKFVDDILIWSANQEGLGFTNSPSNVLTTDNFTKNSLIHPHYKWNYGFRLGIGYTNCCRDWTYDANWIHIENKASKHVAHNSGAPTFKGSYPVWSMSPDAQAGDYVSKASANWHLHTDILDLNAIYNYCFTDNLLLKPFFGVRFQLLQQKLTAKYEGGTFYSGVDENHMRNRSFAAGPRFGIDSDYYIMNGFSISGMFAVDPLYGHFRTKHREFYIEKERFSESDQHNHFSFGYDYSLGLRWRGEFIPSWPILVLGISWEGHEFYNQNRLNRGSFDFFKRDRDLTLSGLTLSADFDF